MAEEWISFKSAVARINIRFPSLENAEEVLLDAIANADVRTKVDKFAKPTLEPVATADAVIGEVNLQASGITWLDLR